VSRNRMLMLVTREWADMADQASTKLTSTHRSRRILNSSFPLHL